MILLWLLPAIICLLLSIGSIFFWVWAGMNYVGTLGTVFSILSIVACILSIGGTIWFFICACDRE